jgi:Predicted dienelactone hydrolase
MRPLELSLIASIVLSCLVYAIPRARRPSFLRFLPLLADLVLFLHLLVESYRWQMVPAYTACALLTALGIRGRFVAGKGVARRHPRLRAAFLVLGSALGLALVAAPPILLPVPELPTPSGPYGVGTMDFEWVDSSRAEAYSPTEGERRDLVVRAWYPASVDPSSPAERPYADMASIGPIMARDLGLPSFALDHMALAKGHSHRDAPLAAASEPFPVLLFSHGYGGILDQNTVQMEQLASRGYVLFSIAHPYDSAAVAYPDKRLVKASEKLGAKSSKAELAQLNVRIRALLDEARSATSLEAEQALVRTLFDLTSAQLGSSLPTWVEDTGFVLSQLELVEAGKGDSPFAGRLDLDRVGVFGHSFGGATAGECCLLDPRFKAGLNLDGLQYGSVMGRSIRQPFMYFSSRGPEYERMNAAIYASHSGPLYHIAVPAAEHYDFTDFSLVLRFLRLPGLKGGIEGARMESIVNGYVAAFFDKELKGLDSGLLEASPYREAFFETSR